MGKPDSLRVADRDVAREFYERIFSQWPDPLTATVGADALADAKNHIEYAEQVSIALSAVLFRDDEMAKIALKEVDGRLPLAVAGVLMDPTARAWYHAKKDPFLSKPVDMAGLYKTFASTHTKILKAKQELENVQELCDFLTKPPADDTTVSFTAFLKRCFEFVSVMSVSFGAATKNPNKRNDFRRVVKTLNGHQPPNNTAEGALYERFRTCALAKRRSSQPHSSTFCLRRSEALSKSSESTK